MKRLKFSTRDVNTSTDNATDYKYTLANLKFKKASNNTSAIIGTIPEHSKVEVLDVLEDWTKIKYQDTTGYVKSKYLSTTKYNWKDAYLRTYPAAESNPVKLLSKGTRIEVIATIGEWSQVIADDDTGYVFSYFLTDDGNMPNAYDFSKFYSDITAFVNDNKILSPTNNLIVTDLTNRMTYIFEMDDNGQWDKIYGWTCDIGKPSTPTITGTFNVSGRKPYFGTDNYRVKYATRIQGGYYYHTVLFNAEGTKITDDRLGLAITHGCIRLAVRNAQWIYDNILDETAIVIH